MGLIHYEREDCRWSKSREGILQEDDFGEITLTSLDFAKKAGRKYCDWELLKVLKRKERNGGRSLVRPHTTLGIHNYGSVRE